MPLPYATIASALLLILTSSKSYSWNFSIFVNGSSPPNRLTIPDVIPPTSEPNPATAVPTPNAAMPPATAAMPLPASINASPSKSSKDFMPSAKVGNDLPTIHVAPAIPAPMRAMAAARAAAPRGTNGLAQNISPCAIPLSIPPSPLPSPLPMPPMALPIPPNFPASPPPILSCGFTLAPPPSVFSSIPSRVLCNFSSFLLCSFSSSVAAAPPCSA